MNFEKIAIVILSIVVIVQFNLSLIKGRNMKEDIGEIVYKLKVSSFKMKFIAGLIALIVIYLISLAVKDNASLLSVLIIAYFLLCIYDFSKVKVVTKNGVALSSIYSKVNYNFVNWKDIQNWYWHKKRDTMLVFVYNYKGKIITSDWEVGKSERETIEELFKTYAAREEGKVSIEEGTAE